jgi:hypothetical protein
MAARYRRTALIKSAIHMDAALSPLGQFSRDVVPVLQLGIAALGLVSLVLVWLQIRQATKWNRFKAHHDLLGYVPDEQLDKEVLRVISTLGVGRDQGLPRPLASQLYDDIDAFVTVKTFINKYEHFCSAINVRAVDEEHAYSLHAGRVINVFQSV